MATSFKWRMAQKLELKWWQNYLGKKDVQMYLEWKKQYWLDFLSDIQETVQIRSSDSVLDAGCGPAGVFTVINAQNVVAVDPLLEAYEQNLDHFSRAMYPQVQFETSSIEMYRPTILFDKVFCLNAINHVADIELAFDQLFDWLQPQGQLIVSIDSHNYKLLKTIFRWIPGDALHPHQYDLEDYRKFITDRNGEILQEVNSKPGNIFDYWVLVVRKK
ncbi:MAG: class I SAM-dependent methyltransferase [Bacteroidetes bacterium]|nr:class I SAM-dependent methyltransferase [Bacteroidota bacterium]